MVMTLSAASATAEARARELVGHGLLLAEQGRFRLSERGLAVADAVAREFLGPARTDRGAARSPG